MSVCSECMQNISGSGGLRDTDDDSYQKSKHNRNALIDLRNHADEVGSIISAAQLRVTQDDGTFEKTIFLPKNYTQADLDKFLEDMNFMTYPDLGNAPMQSYTWREREEIERNHFEIKGVVWFLDGSWSTRANYDFSYFWLHHKRPASPH